MHSNHLGIREPLASTRYLTIPHDGIILRAISFFNHTATTEIYTLSLHDALPISPPRDDCLGIVQSSRLCSRGDRRPLRPPWRNRFSLGQESFGGRSFRFFTPTGLQSSQKHLWPISFRLCPVMSSDRSGFAQDDRPLRLPYQE